MKLTLKFCTLIALLLNAVVIHCQVSETFELKYGVHRSYSGFSLTYDKLGKAENLKDLNQYYEADHVKSFISVQIQTKEKGEIVITKSSDDELTPEQKAQLLAADYGTTISVSVDYFPDYQFGQSEPKEMGFEFVMEAHQPARMNGGESALHRFVEAKISPSLSRSVFRIHHLTGVCFSIDEQGQVANVRMAESSGDQATDELLVDAICALPDWKPAHYEDGKRITVDYVFTIGDHHSCVINVLGIRAHTTDYNHLDLHSLSASN